MTTVTVKRECIECGRPFEAKSVMADGISSVGKPVSICSASCRRKRRNRQQLAWRRRVDCPDHLHGTISGYGTYGCRCDGCRSANTDYTRSKRARNKDASTSDC